MDLFGTKRERARLELWKSVAGELGGTHTEESSGFWSKDNERIEATVHGVPVVVDKYSTSNGKSRSFWTRVRARHVYGPGPTVRIARQGMVESFAKFLGMTDHEIGDAAFDAEYLIRADSAAVAHRLWSDTARAYMMREPLRGMRVKSDREGLELIDGGWWDRREQLIAGVELLSELAGRDLYGREILARVGGTLSADTDGWPRVELDTGVRVTIRAESIADRLAMVARAAERCPLEPGVIAIVDGHVDPALQLPQGAHVAIQTVRTATLMIEESSTWLVFPALEIEPERLRAGAELLGAIATTLPDAYR